MQEAKKLYLYNHYFFPSSQKIDRKNVTNCKNCGIFYQSVLWNILSKRIGENQNQSQIAAGEHLLLQR